MNIFKGTQYLTRNGLLVTVVDKEIDPRDRYPMIGQFENGERKGAKDFWSEGGEFTIGEDGPLDLISVS